MQYNQISMAVLIKGRPITEYVHHGMAFVEGRAGSEYEVEMSNRTNGRIEAVLTVDGLSVLDGKPGSLNSRGYLLEPQQTLRVPGWTLDTQNVAKFAFSGKDKSYATQMTGDARNNGVIGLMAFAAKLYQPSPYAYPNPYFPPPTSSKSKSNNIRSRGIAASSSSIEQKTSGGWITPGVPASDYSYASASLGIAPQMSYDSMNTASSYQSGQNVQNANVVNSLGTAFGEAQTFATTAVEFLRGDMLSYFVVYYDNIKGLRARGVPIERVRKGKYKSAPEAFPAMTGCQPPPGWQG